MLIHFSHPLRLLALSAALGIQLAPLPAAEVHVGAAASNTAPRAVLGNLSAVDALKVFETEPGFRNWPTSP